MRNTAVLVLNQNYEPINICNARRALVLVFHGKAEVLEDNHAILHTTRTAYHCPSVIRLVQLIRRPWPKARLTRREVFLRDGYICQYCGLRTRDLTLDHVVPRHRGGQHTWENLVSACHACNHRKGGRTPAEAHMLLLRPPARPRSTGLLLFYDYAQTYQEWCKFLPEPEAVAN